MDLFFFLNIWSFLLLWCTAPGAFKMFQNQDLAQKSFLNPLKYKLYLTEHYNHKR